MATNLTKRQKSRRYALQALYGWEMSGNQLADIIDNYISKHGNKSFDVSYFKKLLYGVAEHIEPIDQQLSKHTSRTMDKIDLIEKMILRIAAFELLYNKEIPYKVAINEALDLAKEFGSCDGYKFVNGVLDKLVTI